MLTLIALQVCEEVVIATNTIEYWDENFKEGHKEDPILKEKNKSQGIDQVEYIVLRFHECVVVIG